MLRRIYILADRQLDTERKAMRIDTRFNIGDTVWAVSKDYKWEEYSVRGPMQINVISVEIEDRIITEIYACPETDEAYLGDQVHSTKAEALEAMNRLNRQAA
jgi:hypothetical protein